MLIKVEERFQFVISMLSFIESFLQLALEFLHFVNVENLVFQIIEHLHYHLGCMVVKMCAELAVIETTLFVFFAFRVLAHEI